MPPYLFDDGTGFGKATSWKMIIPCGICWPGRGGSPPHDWMVRRVIFARIGSPISLYGILLTFGLVFFGNRFYVASTDTRRVGLNFQLCVPYTRDFRLLIRFCELEFGGSAGSMTERQMASKTNPITFFQQVRAETAKVTWPTRRETVISTIMVVIMAFLAAAFFFLADQLMAYGVEFILGLGR